MSGPGSQVGNDKTEMDGEGGEAAMGGGRFPRCEICDRAVRVRGVGRVGVWCSGCLDAFCGIGG